MTITKEQIEQAVPANLKTSITQSLVDQLNNVVSDPEMAEMVRNNFMSYTAVLRDGKFKTEDYLHAVVYVSYKLMGLTNRESYVRTFPNRYQALLAKGTVEKDIAGYISAYNRGKLVNLILEQTLTPIWVLNQDIYQKAINVQAELMAHANSEKVRSDAADSLLNHLKKPEGLKAQISIDLSETSGMNELKDSLRKMAETQQGLIRQGIPTQQIAGSSLAEGAGEIIDVPVRLIEQRDPVEATKADDPGDSDDKRDRGKAGRSGLFG